jgi:hypothetical protein
MRGRAVFVIRAELLRRLPFWPVFEQRWRDAVCGVSRRRIRRKFGVDRVFGVRPRSIQPEHGKQHFVRLLELSRGHVQLAHGRLRVLVMRVRNVQPLNRRCCVYRMSSRQVLRHDGLQQFMDLQRLRWRKLPGQHFEYGVRRVRFGDVRGFFGVFSVCCLPSG